MIQRINFEKIPMFIGVFIFLTILFGVNGILLAILLGIIYMNYKKNPRVIKVNQMRPQIPLFKIIIGIIIVLVIAIIANSFVIIKDGEVGVLQILGNYDDRELGTGLTFFAPVISTVEKVNVKLSTIEEKVSVPSKEGLIVELDISVIYRVKPEKASEIIQTVSGDIRNTLLIPYVRNGVRDTVSGYDSKAIYSEAGREEIASKVKVLLSEKLKDRLDIHDVLLRDVKLPEKVRNAIEEKIDAEQKAQKKDFELQSAKKDAQIDIERAKGIAESNKIIADSISEEYLRWKFIEALGQSTDSVIYVPTEANLPILEASRISS